MQSLKVVIVFTVLITLLHPAIAQTNYKPGFAITNAGDTIRGFIDQKEWSRNPGSFSFKNSLADEQPTTYDERDVRYFSVGGDEFATFEGLVSIHKNSINPGEVISARFVNDIIFLKVVTKGKLAILYSYRDEIKTRLFLALPPEDPEELIFREYPDSEEKDKIDVDDGYKRQLENVAQKTNTASEKIKRKIKNATFSLDGIADIIDLINGVMRPELPEEQNKGTVFLMGLVPVKGQWHFSRYQGTSPKSSPTYGLGLSLGLIILPKPEIGRIAIRAELSFFSISSTVTYHPTNLDANFLQTVVSFSPQFLYTVYNATKMKVHIGAGVRFNRSLYYIDDIYPHLTELNKTPLWTSLNLQAGILIYRKTELTFSYNPQIGRFTNYDQWAQSFSYFAIGINHHFKKGRPGQVM